MSEIEESNDQLGRGLIKMAIIAFLHFV
ncbi:unnamed protein product, partial [Rotaria sp. Silwood1]